MYDQKKIDLLLVQAKQYVEDQHKKYDVLMGVIKNFIKNNEIIVKKQSEYFFDLYTNDMFNLPKQLTQELYNTGCDIAKWTMLVVKIYKYNSKIYVNNICFITFTYLNKEIYNSIPNYINNEGLKALGPELELCDVYTSLTQPVYVQSWKDMFDREKKLLVQFENEFSTRILKSFEKKTITTNDTSSEDEVEGGLENVVYDIQLNILNNFLLPQYHAICSDIAVSIYNNKVNIKNLQIITSRDFKEEIKELSKIYDKVTYNITFLRLPIDLNMYRMKVYINSLEIGIFYNIASYELIPVNSVKTLLSSSDVYLNSNILCASMIYCKKIKLIEIWYIIYLSQIENKYTNLLKKLYSDFKYMCSFKQDLSLTLPINYIGKYENMLLIKERTAARLKERYIPPFIPNVISTAEKSGGVKTPEPQE